MATYTTTRTRTVTGGTLDIVEDVLYGGARVGGVDVTIAPLPGAKIGQLGQANAANTIQSSTQLQQDVDITYDDGTGAAVVGHIRITAQPDATLPTGHSCSIEVSISQPIPFAINPKTLG